VFEDVAKKKVGLEGEAAVGAVEKKSEEATEETIEEETALNGAKTSKPVDDIRKYTDKSFRQEYPEICAALMEKAKEGSISHIKMLLEIMVGKYGDPETAKQRVGKSLSELLLDELKRRQDEREAAINAAKAEESTKANEAEGEGVKSGGDAERG
jgi:hypothetical protein